MRRFFFCWFKRIFMCFYHSVFVLRFQSFIRSIVWVSTQCHTGSMLLTLLSLLFVICCSEWAIGKCHSHATKRQRELWLIEKIIIIIIIIHQSVSCVMCKSIRNIGQVRSLFFCVFFTNAQTRTHAHQCTPLTWTQYNPFPFILFSIHQLYFD